MLKANDVAGQLHRLSQPRPQGLLVFQYGSGKRKDLPIFVLLCCYFVWQKFPSHSILLLLCLCQSCSQTISRLLLGRHFEYNLQPRWRFRSGDPLCPRVIFPAATISKNKKNFGTRLTVNLHLSFPLDFFSFLSFSYLRNVIGTYAHTLAQVVTPLKIQKN